MNAGVNERDYFVVSRRERHRGSASMPKQTVIRASGVAKGFRSHDLPANLLKQAALGAASRLLPSGASRDYLTAKAASYGSVFWAL
ncbi:hypothetical protein PPH41_40750, partial [Burkholderia gladioli]|nr:hypothetical protein [Burkholderia gladioli]